MNNKEYQIIVGQKIYKCSNDDNGVQAAKSFVRSNGFTQNDVAIGRKTDGIYVLARVPLKAVIENVPGKVFSLKFERV